MVNIAVIGSGFGKVGLLPAFTNIPNCKVIAVCTDRSAWRALLERSDVDAVAIAVPPAAQYKIARAAIKKGIHVFAEKPLAANLAQARELAALAKKKRVITGVDFMFPEINEWKKVKALLRSRAFGALRHVSVNWDWHSGDLRYGRKTWRTSVKEGGGALSFYFSHGLYYLEQFAGAIRGVRSAFTYSARSAGGGESGVDMLLAFEGGASGYAHVSCNSPGRVRHQLVFECARGVIVLENKSAIVDNFTVRTFSRAGERKVKVAKDRGRKGQDERVKIVRKLARRFVSACRRGRQMSPSFSEGLRVQELIEKVRVERMA